MTNKTKDTRREFDLDNHERLIRVEVKQDILNQQFADHERHDEERFHNINQTLKEFNEIQTKTTTTLWLVGSFIIVAVPVITALVIHFTSR